ncbi:MAG: heme-binding protein, partial [Planctomycetes bacterium]|nr:heme-binding protein [Planctomycetota bacterium]
MKSLRVSLVCLSALTLANLAAADEPKTEIARWEFESGTDGWKAIKDCKLQSADGALTIIATGRDPHLSVNVAAAEGWKQFTFRARFKGRREGQLFWTTTKDPTTSQSKSLRFSLRSRDDAWHNYKVYFNPDGGLTSIRFDPHDRPGKTEVAFMALANRPPPPPQATPVDRFNLLPGFKAELLYSVPSREHGSWVSLTTDNKGRLITSDQYGKLYRITPPPLGKTAPIKIQPIDLNIGMAHGLLYAFDSLYVMVNGQGAGLYRLRDTDRDDQFDQVKQLRAIPGTGEHGPHAIVLSPDGKSIYICGGNHTPLPKPEKSLVPRNWQEDIPHDRMWDAGGHAVGKMAPGGWICRIDPEGKTFELVSIGFRNEYDIAFNAEGELFTYDADMEWDVGSPWYRPTRVLHATSGSDFGWRSGTGKWPVYYPDSLPSVVDIGPGSPTGIVFGRKAKFPAKYQRALFIADWSYGVIYAVHMKPKGASYEGVAERFASAAPLPVTDMIVNPRDGALYFTIGGRRTQSGLYRVTYVGDEPTDPAARVETPNDERRLVRRDLEKFHRPGKGVAQKLWPYLAHADRHTRFAARIAIEHQPVETWQQRALEETNAGQSIYALIALARSGDKSLLPKVIAALARIEPSTLETSQLLDLLRAYQLTFLRMGPLNETARAKSLERLDSLYPSPDRRVNRELCQLLVLLKAPNVVGRTIDLLAKAPTQEEQIDYALFLRKHASGWTLDQRQRYFRWFNKAAGHRGGHSFSGFLGNIRNEAIASLSATDKAKLQDVL